jgi:hypothetical protein
LLGAFVADAATMPLHWIYSPEKITAILQGKDPEFYERPSSPFYQYPVGDLSPYGAEAFFVLKSVVEHGGVQVWTKLWQDHIWICLLENASSVERNASMSATFGWRVFDILSRCKSTGMVNSLS